MTPPKIDGNKPLFQPPADPQGGLGPENGGLETVGLRTGQVQTPNDGYSSMPAGESAMSVMPAEVPMSASPAVRLAAPAPIAAPAATPVVYPPQVEIENGRVKVEVVESAGIPGSREFWVTDATGQRQLHGRLLQRADGKTIYVGEFTKSVRNYFQKTNVPWPDSSVIPGSRLGQPILVDDYMQVEFWKFFADPKSYQPAEYLFADGEHLGRFYGQVEHFLGVADPVARSNWNKADFHLKLGRYREVPPTGIALEGGGRLQFSADGVPQVVSATGDVQTAEVKLMVPRQEVALPARLKEGVSFEVETVGLSAPGGVEGRTTHKIFTFPDPAQGRNIAVSFDSAQAVYTNVDIFAFSHHHADHIDPNVLLEQIRHNSSQNVSTTLLMDPVVAETVLPQIAEMEGYMRGGPTTPVEFLNERGLFVTVSNEMTIGGNRIKMETGYRGAHGVPQAGITVRQGARVVYFDTSDGDFDPYSMEKRQAAERAAIEGLNERMRPLEDKRLKTPEEHAELADLKEQRMSRQQVVDGIQRSLELGLKAETLHVDQGTSGFDTHSAGKAARNWRQYRLENDPKALKFLEGHPERMTQILEMAEKGDWSGLRRLFLEHVKAAGLHGESPVVADYFVNRMREVSATHNLGYQATEGGFFGVDTRAGRIETFLRNGMRSLSSFTETVRSRLEPSPADEIPFLNDADVQEVVGDDIKTQRLRVSGESPTGRKALRIDFDPSSSHDGIPLLHESEFEQLPPEKMPVEGPRGGKGIPNLLDGATPYLIAVAFLGLKLAEHYQVGTADQRAGASLGMAGGMLAADAPLFLAFAALGGVGMVGGEVGMRNLSDAVGKRYDIPTLQEGQVGNVVASFAGEFGGGMLSFLGAVKLFGEKIIHNAASALPNYVARTVGPHLFAAEEAIVNVGRAGLNHLRASGQTGQAIVTGLTAAGTAIGVAGAKIGTGLATTAGTGLLALAGKAALPGIALGAAIHYSGAGRVIGTTQAGEALGDKIYSWLNKEEPPRVTKRGM